MPSSEVEVESLGLEHSHISILGEMSKLFISSDDLDSLEEAVKAAAAGEMYVDMLHPEGFILCCELGSVLRAPSLVVATTAESRRGMERSVYTDSTSECLWESLSALVMVLSLQLMVIVSVAVGVCVLCKACEMLED